MDKVERSTSRISQAMLVRRKKGAGKSTQSKRIMGYSHPTEAIDGGGREQAIAIQRTPRVWALAWFYSTHRCLRRSPEKSGVARRRSRVFKREGKKTGTELSAQMPVRCSLNRVSTFPPAIGKKWKKSQAAYLKQAILILDEPTSCGPGAKPTK